MSRVDEYQRKRVEVGRELIHELLRTCPDAVIEDEIQARNNGAARAALGAALDILTVEAPSHRTAPGDVWYDVGRREVALRIISAVELSMYDPRSHPARYDPEHRVDKQSDGE